MKKFFSILLLAVLVSTAAFSAESSVTAIPDGADIDLYPVLGRPLTADQMAAMGLTPVHLDAYLAAHGATMLRVHNRQKNDMWQLEDLNPRKHRNEVLLIDRSGEPRYLQSCGNRIVVAHPCPVVPLVTSTSSGKGTTDDDAAGTSESNNASNAWGSVPWHLLGWRLFWLLLLAGIMLIAMLIWWALTRDLARPTPTPIPVPRSVTPGKPKDDKDGQSRSGTAAVVAPIPATPTGPPAANADSAAPAAVPVVAAVTQTPDPPQQRVPDPGTIEIAFSGDFEVAQNDGHSRITIRPRV